MEVLTLTQLEKLTGLPHKWVKSKVKQGIPTGAWLSPAKNIWAIPCVDREVLKEQFISMWRREEEEKYQADLNLAALTEKEIALWEKETTLKK